MLTNNIVSFQQLGPVHVAHFCALCEVKTKMSNLQLIVNNCQLASQLSIIIVAEDMF